MSYIHGYSHKEQQRLLTQNDILSKYIYQKIDFSGVKHLLEIGCGVGAQMIKVLTDYKDIKVTGIDISPQQLEQAKINLKAAEIEENRYTLMCGDILREIPYMDTKPDGLLMVWLLEHVSSPDKLLKAAVKMVETGAKVFITEVYHQSFGYFPKYPLIDEVWQKMISHQAFLKGDGNIGLQLYNIMKNSGLKDIKVEPFLIYIDGSEQERKAEQFLYWRDLIDSSMPELISSGKCTEAWRNEVFNVMTDLAKNDDSVFYYTFIQGFAIK